MQLRVVKEAASLDLRPLYSNNHISKYNYIPLKLNGTIFSLVNTYYENIGLLTIPVKIRRKFKKEGLQLC
ncbi:hypothetical protein [Arcticibacter tournemirensis]|uniref:Uncharacterized protein n=1 Tax=Arcticibacter tournemirensis TaxID=699437 RepID=A0A4Q0M4G3_9SPHI|nr:hypothetical protein [Arcticibacter tournemirensis]RXF67516.1 hypothetical protein EKH83_19420 [Arcticibacter tournemirensis]